MTVETEARAVALMFNGMELHETGGVWELVKSSIRGRVEGEVVDSFFTLRKTVRPAVGELLVSRERVLAVRQFATTIVYGLN